ASLFNGALFTAECLDRVGVPDLRLFIRGDEVEVHRRLVRSGLAFGTCLTTAYLHPQGSDEFKPILGGRMHTQFPDDPVKRHFTFRNRGYLLSQPGMRRLIPQEIVRFTWYFLVSRRALRQALRPASARWHPLPARMFAGPTGRPVPGTGAPWGHDRLESTTVRCRRPVRRGPARRHRLGGPHTVQQLDRARCPGPRGGRADVDPRAARRRVHGGGGRRPRGPAPWPAGEVLRAGAHRGVAHGPGLGGRGVAGNIRRRRGVALVRAGPCGALPGPADLRPGRPRVGPGLLAGDRPAVAGRARGGGAGVRAPRPGRDPRPRAVRTAGAGTRRPWLVGARHRARPHRSRPRRLAPLVALSRIAPRSWR